MTRSSLQTLFAPESVAIVGASADPAKVEGSVLANLRASGFAGRIVPVNRSRSEVQGLPAVPSLRAVTEALDVAVVAVPADDVLPTLKDCVAVGVPSADTLGWIRPSRRLNLSFAAGTPRAGPIGFFSQSCALCTAILDWSRGRGLGFSLFASLGTQADVTETDVLAALADDPETSVIVGYVEGVEDGRRFFDTSYSSKS